MQIRAINVKKHGIQTAKKSRAKTKITCRQTSTNAATIQSTAILIRKMKMYSPNLHGKETTAITFDLMSISRPDPGTANHPLRSAAPHQGHGATYCESFISTATHRLSSNSAPHAQTSSASSSHSLCHSRSHLSEGRPQLHFTSACTW